MIEYHPCVGCGFKMFDELPGSYDACEICFWTDDATQLRNPIATEPSNAKSLYEHQQDILQEYPMTVEVVGEFLRDPDWRPIREDELPAPEDVPDEGLDYFYVRQGDDATYYWQRD